MPKRSRASTVVSSQGSTVTRRPASSQRSSSTARGLTSPKRSSSPLTSSKSVPSFWKSVPTPIRRPGNMLLSPAVRAKTKTPAPQYYTPVRNARAAPPTRPMLSMNEHGNLVDPVNFENRPAIPLRKFACGQYLESNARGFRGPAFRKCFVQYLAKMTRPAFAIANAARGNAAKMNAACAQKRIAPHQIVLSEIAKVMAAVPTEKLGGHRGIIAWQNAGSGKTIGSLAVIFAFWPSRRKIFVVTSPSNKPQAEKSYLDDAPRFFPKEYREICDEYRKRTGSVKDDMGAFEDAFKARVKVWTFELARNRVAQKPGEFKGVREADVYGNEGSVMIIDEAHGLAMRSLTDKTDDAVKLGCALRGLSRQQMNKLCVFAMTATPGNSIRQWMKLLSVVRRSDQLPFALDTDVAATCGPSLATIPGLRDDAISLERRLAEATSGKGNSKAAFGSIVKYVNENLFGLVSYVDIRSDLSTHACVKEIDMRVPLDTYYYLALVKAVTAMRVQGDPAHASQFNRVPSQISKFMKRAREWSSSIPKELYSKTPKEFVQYMKTHHRFLNERLVSPKLVRVAEYIATKPGKQYAYTVNPNHKVLAKALETWHGMRDVTDIFVDDPSLQTRALAALKSSGGKNVLGLQRSSSRRNIIVLTNTMKVEHRKVLVSIFNSTANLNGDYIRAVIATDQLYEGLDLFGLEHVNLVDPLPSALQEIQAIGRGPRFCSHRGLPMSRRVVHVIRWFATAPKNSSWTSLESSLAHMKGARGRGGDPVLIRREYDRLHGKGYDEYVFQASRGDEGFLALTNFEQIMKSASLDCAVLGRYHPGVSCSVPRLSKSATVSAGRSCQ